MACETMAAQLRGAACAAKFAELQACETMATQLRAAAQAAATVEEKNAAWEQNGYSLPQPLFESYESLHHPSGCFSLEPVPEEEPEKGSRKGAKESSGASESTTEDTGESSDGASEDLSGEEIKIRAPWRKVACR